MINAEEIPPGWHAVPPAPRCGAITELTDTEIAAIVRQAAGRGGPVPTHFDLIHVTAECGLSPGHPHRHTGEQAILHGLPGTVGGLAAWLQWDNSTRDIEWHEWLASPDGNEEPCTLPPGPPGQHNVTEPREP